MQYHIRFPKYIQSKIKEILSENRKSNSQNKDNEKLNDKEKIEQNRTIVIVIIEGEEEA